MVDVERQSDYWRSAADEDIAAAESLAEKGHLRHALFFAHLSIEKMLKALVVKVTGDLAPRTHDLLRLAERAGVSVSPERREFLAHLQRYCVEGRFPETMPVAPSHDEVRAGLTEARETLEWLSLQLS
ncbi:MAG: HEPN domain-containing protein [Planctomycetota bacterium]|jgi:HEPN domain-containing protein